jgi:hypothetical protein
MASTKAHGKTTAVFWKKTGESTYANISGSSRQFGFEESAQEQDVSTRDDLNENATQYLVGVPGRTATLAGLDTTPAASRVWRTIKNGETGSLLWYPLGTGSTRPYEFAEGVVTKDTYGSPHDNAATWDLAWRLNTAISEAVSA